MNIENFPYNPTVEKIVEILMIKTQNYDPQFFRLQTNFYLSLIPSAMHIFVNSPITGKIPINMYAISLMHSGGGKGFSTGLLEQRVINLFRNEFMHEVFPKKSAIALEMEANNRASYMGLSIDEALQQLTKEFKSYGAYQFAFSEGSTTPAIKQLRNKIILADCGSINIHIDEIGMNLNKSEDSLATLLELYDKGLIKNKLTKNTENNARFQELIGSTPANLNMFGSPNKLLNGAKTEEDFFSLLETGYARRSFFCFSSKKENEETLTPEQQYDLLTKGSNDHDLDIIAHQLFNLANVNLVGTEVDLPRDVGIKLIEYRQYCENRAKELPEYQEIQKAELNHRYFKALKLAGAYAFLDGVFNITENHLQQAIRFTEDSGQAVERLFYREKPYERLAKYIAESKSQLTQVDITNDLPFYKGSQAARNEMMTMAIAWGYKNNIIIKKQFADGVELISGETLEENDLSNTILAYSQSWSSDYLNAGKDGVGAIPFDNLDQLVTLDGYHFINHYTKTGNRNNKDMIEGFNTIVLDIDNTTSLQEAMSLLKDYKYLIYTTKRHQVTDPETGECNDRFRVILPMQYVVKLNTDEYKEFMKNVMHWLPFNGLDTQTFQPSRKWSCYVNAQVYKNEGNLIDPTLFIPRTSRNDEYIEKSKSLGSLDNIERWFAGQLEQGRNNTLIKYGLMLMDSGMSYDDIAIKLLSFNGKLDNPLDEAEIYNTVLTSIRNKMIKHS